jgi:hypothetical protein
LSFTTRAFTATRRERVRTPLPSRLHPFWPFNLSAPAARVESPAFLPRSGQTIGVAASPADGLMHLAKEGFGTLPHDPRRTRRTPVANLARTDAELIVVACHGATIEGRNQ